MVSSSKMAGPSTREERDSIRALRLSLLPEAWRWTEDSDWGVLLRFQNHWLGRVVWMVRAEGEAEGARERDWRAGRRAEVVVGVVAVSVGAVERGS